MTSSSGLPRIVVTFGTRPEAIKMFPVVAALRETGRFDVKVVVTAQHRDLLDSVLALAGLVPDVDLDLMQPDQSLDALSTRLLSRFGAVLDELSPDRVLVHGDTLTTMMASLACYFRRIPVGHVEAGLRSGDIYSPWPEEVNRKVTGVIADLNFAPTETAAAALRAENVAESAIHVTGNTVIDALLFAKDKIAANPALAPAIAPLRARFAGRRIIAVTAHRRENFGAGMAEIAKGLQILASRDDVAIIYPLHPNPNVGGVMRPALAGFDNIALIEPLDYLDFVAMMEACDLILTDSGGIQEEAPSLGKPVLVMRDTTERPEGVAAGTARLVGADGSVIARETAHLLDNAGAYEAMARAHNPYGDGTASRRIAAILAGAG
ncbi:non-hydrolyzing UDP-N-acetylglucosamine 2-epimerase [Erythrobacter sp. BLCC-B19]|uniref:non-hydrolyzing UDP-N-acetylglucosamine 2-epimerase n=1 Tax=Erythrobacter sp. BLCC-B19 TaxID=3025315 RepID=UPI002362A612|nr:UDP-N-acetylglucosamine 2-epimerase (non-hydrolyzing) [Erythrobacter sp. BLCC-B19]WDA41843.1 UDP-N-acetylglucosamine 2-epimerase (non-hydrolyzing) [Erythrobacter sp. BLCC-B19]